ncbi:MAG: hypothetical protein Unbinned6805contig1000_32 [Prokaryotic dsDNA virus sp.]|nr:MAG: hypothetical protein Unbinned6805contig1000_32 [Prokaryotic dsDNA virus sp.]|tara:strand:- start:34031 stop:34300 length:270 start_codon:yes stop_codon:yes gene_type:complete
MHIKKCLDKFVEDISNSGYEDSEDVLQELGELYVTSTYKPLLEGMACSYCKIGKVSLSRVFMSGFLWEDTPQGGFYWKNFYRHLALKGI